MAEKEERILIKKQINYHPPYGGWCGDGKEIVLTRQEAIERIAYALAQRRYRGLADAIQFAEDENWQICLTDANYALNALLSK